MGREGMGRGEEGRGGREKGKGKGRGIRPPPSDRSGYEPVNIIFNELRQQRVKYGVHTTSKIKHSTPFFIMTP